MVNSDAKQIITRISEHGAFIAQPPDETALTRFSNSWGSRWDMVLAESEDFMKTAKNF